MSRYGDLETQAQTRVRTLFPEIPSEDVSIVVAPGSAELQRVPRAEVFWIPPARVIEVHTINEVVRVTYRVGFGVVLYVSSSDVSAGDARNAAYEKLDTLRAGIIGWQPTISGAGSVWPAVPDQGDAESIFEMSGGLYSIEAAFSIDWMIEENAA